MFCFQRFDTGILRGATSLHWSAGAGHLEVCQFLVENGADVNAKDDEYDTLLYTHVLHTHMDIHWNHLFRFLCNVSILVLSVEESRCNCLLLKVTWKFASFSLKREQT